MCAFAKKGSFIAFLRSEEDATLQSGLWPFLHESIPKDLRHRAGRLTIQAVVKTIEESGHHADWNQDFREKYGLQQTGTIFVLPAI